MAKILVADDNSNVQKTVALALAGLGVDVISVNNGEAAVRKLADVSPDLVLADIFMPVRNGYEVCEYVKKDNRFAHVPVVLLVGAFDPLDEREAQRVGADGILKKPFVPPDPLITMVKTLLERTMGERLVAVSVSKPSAAAAGRSTGTAIAEEHSPPSETSEESSTQAPSISSGRVSFDGGEHPVAFSQLLAPPEQDAIAPSSNVIEPVDNDQILTSSRDATLGDPIFWRNDAPEPEKPEAAEAPEDPEDLSAALDLRAWKQGEDSLPRREDALLLQPIEPLELVRDEQEESPQTIVDSKSILLDQAAQAPLHVESGSAPQLAANPIEWMATAPPEHAEETVEQAPRWDDPLPESAEAIEPVELADHTSSEPAVEWSVPEKLPSPVSASVESPVSESIESTLRASAESLISSSILSPAVPAISAAPEEKHEDKLSEPIKTVPAAPQSVLQSPEETAHSIRKQDWADMTADLGSGISIIEPLKDTQRIKPESLLRALQSRLTEPAKEQSKTVSVPVVLQPAANGSNSLEEHIEPAAVHAATIPAAAVASSLPASANLAPAPTPDPVLVEAVVQRVLDKMRPQVVDIITKEFLRPIVQALVHREIEKH
ncbi:MAG: response regulator [Candidatus Acidiferrales bacterium]